MRRSYSQDLHSRIVAAVESGTSRNKAAQQFAVSVSRVVKLMQRFHRTGTTVPAARGKKPYALAEHETTVREPMATHPDLTLDELRRELAARGIFVGRSSVNRFLQTCGMTLKKSLHAAEQQRPDVAAAREAWRAGRSNLDSTRLIFIDETWRRPI
jgi:transposase